MRIVETYSHLNGEEYLLVHHPAAYEEVKQTIRDVDAFRCRSKRSREKTMPGKILFSPRALNAEFKVLFSKAGWVESRYEYYVTTQRKYLPTLVSLSAKEQREFLVAQGVSKPISSYKQTDFVKERIAVEVQFGKYAFVAFDLFVKHLLFYSGDVINVGVEVLPMKEMLSDPEGGRRMSEMDPKIRTTT